jgi:hypothetical protein
MSIMVLNKLEVGILKFARKSRLHKAPALRTTTEYYSFACTHFPYLGKIQRWFILTTAMFTSIAFLKILSFKCLES